jgi:hypothetical protein
MMNVAKMLNLLVSARLDVQRFVVGSAFFVDELFFDIIF